jgi:7,8-dihydropterin-6-yl-methyl-4-(beta-D-ribofuranosyl)aminobenzene 5'-phosphate synthase
MKITTLIENSIAPNSIEGLGSEHGLSVYIEIDDTKILFDVGKTDLFAKNAELLNINIAEIDYLIISHGHYDHGGGLKTFFELNQKAKVYMHTKAVIKHYSKVEGKDYKYNGLDISVVEANMQRIQFIEQEFCVCSKVKIITDFGHKFPRPEGNLALYEEQNGVIQHDSFNHEIALMIEEESKSVLFTACSHCGIINMYNKAICISNHDKFDLVFGGLHLHRPSAGTNESQDYLDLLITELKRTGSVFYTGHCTGLDNFSYLKSKLGNQLNTMNTGDVVEV